MSVNGFRALVFDWDGTLLDSEQRIVACFQAAGTDLGLAPIARSAVRELIGLGLREAISMLFPQGDENFYGQFTDCYRKHFISDAFAPAQPFHGVAKMLQIVRQQGFQLAIATGKSRAGLSRELRQTGLLDVFHATRCADETRSKPHPEMLLQLISELQVSPQDVLMIGDTEYDMEMASRAGTASLAVSHGVHERERLMNFGPLGCLDDIAVLPNWLNQLSNAPREK